MRIELEAANNFSAGVIGFLSLPADYAAQVEDNGPLGVAVGAD
jgi:hypothetical protein